MGNARGWLAAAALTVIMTPTTAWTAESTFPSRPLRFVVPFAAGAATDNLARMLGQRLAERLGQPVVVDNRPGGGGTVGTAMVAKASPDGHTLLMASTSLAINATLYRDLPYDAVRDLTAISHVVNLPNALFTYPGLPASNVTELIAYARRNPGKVTYGSGGVGNAAHLAMELLAAKANVELVHVPYRGGALALTDIIAGRVSVMFISVYTAQAHVRSGKLKSLGVASLKRSAVVPDWPTLAEGGLPGFEFNAWYGVMSAGATPANLVTLLNREIVAIMRAPDVSARVITQGAEVVASTAETFANMVRDEVAKWAPVVKASGAQPG